MMNDERRKTIRNHPFAFLLSSFNQRRRLCTFVSFFLFFHHSSFIIHH